LCHSGAKLHEMNESTLISRAAGMRWAEPGYVDNPVQNRCKTTGQKIWNRLILGCIFSLLLKCRIHFIEMHADQ